MSAGRTSANVVFVCTLTLLGSWVGCSGDRADERRSPTAAPTRARAESESAVAVAGKHDPRPVRGSAAMAQKSADLPSSGLGSAQQPTVPAVDDSPPDDSPPHAASPAEEHPPPAGAKPVDDIPTRWPAAPRVVAIGDVHGDRGASRRALVLAGAIDDEGAWIGGELVVVQTGDQIDRGDEDREVLDELEKLTEQASAQGGAFILLNGNHELMNALGDLRYVTPASFRSFESLANVDRNASVLAQVPAPARARMAAFLPGGPYARLLARRNVVVVVGDTVFAHGGVLPQYASELDTLNRNARAWLRGDVANLPPAVMAEDGPLWSRHYSNETGPAECKLLAESLLRIGAKRMVVGHTPQLEGITSACNDRVWRIDVGMSQFYGGPMQVLELKRGRVRVLSEDARNPKRAAAGGRATAPGG